MQIFRGVAFVIYCDPLDPNYSDILKTMCECRQKVPLELKADENGEIERDQGSNVVFVLTHNPDLMYYKFEYEGP